MFARVFERLVAFFAPRGVCAIFLRAKVAAALSTNLKDYQSQQMLRQLKTGSPAGWWLVGRLAGQTSRAGQDAH